MVFLLRIQIKKIGELINKSYEIGVRKLIIITGKGIHSDNEKILMCQKNLVN